MLGALGYAEVVATSVRLLIVDPRRPKIFKYLQNRFKDEPGSRSSGIGGAASAVSPPPRPIQAAAVRIAGPMLRIPW